MVNRSLRYLAAALALATAMMLSPAAYGDGNTPEGVGKTSETSLEEAGSNVQAKHQQPEKSASADEQPMATLQSGFRQVAENEKLILGVNEETLNLSVVDKTTGFDWNNSHAQDGADLNDTWSAFASSGVTITYFDASSMLQQLSSTDASAKLTIHSTQNGFAADVDFTDVGISFQVLVSLKGDTVSVQIPYESIVENHPESYSLRAIIAYPFLGASEGTTDGEFLIPDGCGALIDLNRKTVATQNLATRFYGDDIGIFGATGLSKNANASAAPNTMTMPVFGMAYQRTNGCLAYVASGSEYSELNVYLSGITTNYNFIYNSFIYRDTYMQPISRDNAGVPKNQQDKNEFDAEIKYIFLTGEEIDYADLAVRYRQELLADGTLAPDATDSAGLRLEFFMADNAESMLGKELIVMTTANDCRAVVDELYEDGFQNLCVGLTGYTQGGLTGSYPKHLGFEKKTGSQTEYQELLQDAKEKGLEVSLDVDYVTADSDGSGYKKSDIARTIAEQFVDLYGSHVLSPAATTSIYEKQVEAFQNLGVESLAMKSMGETLYSSWVTNPYTRAQTIQAYQKILEQQDFKYLLYGTDQYLWRYAEALAHIPMTASDYLMTSESVPFMQMVLKGSVTMYTSPQNLNVSGRQDLLRMVDYGVNPDYMLTEENPIELFRTQSNWLFTSQYDVWKEDIQAVYQEVIPVLEKVQGAEFVSRDKLADQVYRTEYSNGVVVIVNYSQKPFTYEGVTVAAEGFGIV